jgi:carbon-monoxide dehydrogenase large subunit
VHPLQKAVASYLDVPVERVRAIAPDVGGGFGTKAVLYPEELLVAYAAWHLRRPVKWIEDRVEHLQSAIHARDQRHDIALALDSEGHILALEDRFNVDAGAFNPLGIVIPYNSIAHLMGPYRVPSLHAEARVYVTNKTPTAPYRGAGRPEAVFAMERIIDRAARALDMDPVDLRMRNLVTEQEMPYAAGIPYRDARPIVLDSGDYPESLSQARSLITGPSDRTPSPRASVGVGYAMYVEGTAIGPFEGAVVRVEANGRVSVATGAASQGQGHRTVFAQICADALDVSPLDVDVTGGDSGRIRFGWGTVASRSLVVAGNAVSSAADEVRTKLLRAASEILEVAPEDLAIADGVIAPLGAPAQGIAVKELAASVRPGTRGFRDLGAGLEATVYYEPPTVTWANGVHAARVAVDRETHEVEVLDYVVVHDCGRIVNPMIVDGQVHGGVAQGIGGALYEEIVHDEDGQLRTATFMDYLLPTSQEMPPLLLTHLETPSPLNPLGLKGVGEGGAIPVPAAVANAVEAALHDTGVVIRRTPISPDYLYALVTSDVEAAGRLLASETQRADRRKEWE